MRGDNDLSLRPAESGKRLDFAIEKTKPKAAGSKGLPSWLGVAPSVGGEFLAVLLWMRRRSS